jgi:hypothetical protein
LAVIGSKLTSTVRRVPSDPRVMVGSCSVRTATPSATSVTFVGTVCWRSATTVSCM